VHCPFFFVPGRTLTVGLPSAEFCGLSMMSCSHGEAAHLLEVLDHDAVDLQAEIV
jgi:hypothetical protein